MERTNQAGIFIPQGRQPWPHERHVAETLANAGYYVEFLAERSIKTPDIRINGAIEFEIKSPEGARAITIERAIKKALKQCPNIIIDASRMKGVRESQVIKHLAFQLKARKQIKRMLFVTRRGEIIDISNLI